MDGNCTDTTIAALLTVNKTGINYSGQNRAYTIYPNPAKNILIIKSANEIDPENYTILDETGRTLKYGHLFNSSTPIDISDLSKGLYFLQIKGSGIYNFRFVKQ